MSVVEGTDFRRDRDIRDSPKSLDTMSLEQHVARIFDDQEPTRFGSGWLSGTTSVFLGAIGLAAVACFHFPELLSSPDVRARLPMPFVRTTLQLVIGFANVSWRFPRVVEALIVTPRFHHWHHGAEAAALDKNFAVHLPWIDRLFGTYHCPQGSGRRSTASLAIRSRKATWPSSRIRSRPIARQALDCAHPPGVACTRAPATRLRDGKLRGRRL